MKHIVTVFCLMGLVLVAGCGKKRLAPTEYQAYLANPQNGLAIVNEGKAIKTELMLEPLQWQAFKASFVENAMDQKAFDAYLEKNKGVLQFSFKVFLPDAADLYTYFASKYENPQEAMLYCEYDMKDDFKLLAGNGTDSLTANVVHYQPSFGLKPYEEFLLLFYTNDAAIENKSLHLVYNDHVFGLKKLSYEFGEETMKNIPVLKN